MKKPVTLVIVVMGVGTMASCANLEPLHHHQCSDRERGPKSIRATIKEKNDEVVLKVKKGTITVCEGDKLTINLDVDLRGNNPLKIGQAKTQSNASWLNADNQTETTIIIDIDPNAFVDTPQNRQQGYTEYKYDFVVDEVGKLDPRVRVKDN